MPARAFTTYRSAGPVLPEFLSNLKNLFKVAYIYPYDVSAARTQNSKDFFTVKVILVNTVFFSHRQLAGPSSQQSQQFKCQIA